MRNTIVGGVGLLFLLVACGLLPAHLAHGHETDTDDPHQNCDLCLKSEANPFLIAAAIDVPPPVATAAVPAVPNLPALFADPAAPRGRAPPLRNPAC